MKSTSNVFRFNNKYPFDNWTLKDGKLLGYYPRNSFINILSAKDNGIGVYSTYCVIRPNTKVIGRNCFKNNKRFGFYCLCEGIERIEQNAFVNIRAKDIGIPRSIKYIHKNAFSKSTLLFVYPGSYAEAYAKKNGYLIKYYQEGAD